jgi:hypothetical protein
VPIMSKLLLSSLLIAFVKIAFAQSCPPGSTIALSAPVCVKSTAAFCPPGFGEPFEGQCRGPALCPVGYRYAPNMNPLNGGGMYGEMDPVDPCVMEVPMNGYNLQGMPNSLEMQWQTYDQRR